MGYTFDSAEPPKQVELEEGAWAYLNQFGKSAIESTGELFGRDVSDETLQFQREHPTAAFMSELVGMGGPYVGWAKIATKIPKLVKAMDRAEDAFTSPWVGGAARDVTMFAPFEAGRTAVSLTQDAPLGDMLADNALALTIGGVFGGTFNSFKKMGTTLESVEGMVDVNAPSQLIIRELQAIDKQTLKPEQLNAVNRAVSKLKQAVRDEAGTPRYVAGLNDEKSKKVYSFIGSLGSGKDTRAINRWMGVRGRRLNDVETPNFAELLKSNQIDPDTFEGYAKFPRLVWESRKRPNKVQATLKRSLNDWNDGSTFIKREVDESLYVVAKKIENGSDKGWLMFRTDTPGKFAPAAEAWNSRIAKASAWEKDLVSELESGSSLMKLAGYPMRKLSGTKAPTEAQNAFLDGFGKWIDKHILPRPFQLKNSPLGRGMLMSMEATFDGAAAMARKFTFGERALDPSRNVLVQALTGNTKVEGASVKQFVDKIDDWEGFNKVITEEIPVKELNKLVGAGELSLNTKLALERMHQVMDFVDQSEILRLQKLVGVDKYKPREGHYGLPRIREGDHRVSIYDENGRTIKLIGAGKPENATQEADFVIKEAQASGRKWSRSESYLRDESVDAQLIDEYKKVKGTAREDRVLADQLYKRALLDYRSSKTFLPRENVGGFVKEWDTEKVLETFGSHLDVKMKYAASLATRHTLAQYGDKIRHISGKHALDVILRRLTDFEGAQGKIAQASNEFTDKALGRVLGKNSATKIAQAVNTYYMHMTLGAMNIAYPAINALTFLQTVMPHVAFLKNAPDDMLARYYDSTIVQARNGVMAVNTVNPFKITMQSAKMLSGSYKSKQWQKVLNRALNDGTIDPKFMEGYVGEHAEKFLNLREQMKTPLGWAKTIKGISLLTMESGERLSRMHSLATGYRVGKDFMRIQDPDQLYMFAKHFTDNTMFRYATPDRPTLFAGPVGSIFGLFKNWMMQYTMWMVQHAGMIKRNPGELGAWKPLLWQVGGTTAVGGVGAWPFFELVDNFSEFVSDKNVMENVYENFTTESGNDLLSDAIYYGLPALLGTSLTAQAAMPFHAPLRDAEFMFMPVQLDRIQALGRAIGDTVDRFDAAGQFNPLDSQKLSLEWARALAPKTVYRGMASSDEGTIRSARTGQPLVREVGVLDRLGYTFGLMPTEVDRTFRVANELWNDQDSRKAMIQAMGQEWKEAQSAGDYRAVMDVMQRAMLAGIDPSRVSRSAQSRLAREQSDMVNSMFAPVEIWKHRHSLPDSSGY